jgi:TatD DNase family protein
MQWFDIGVNLLDKRICNSDVLLRSVSAGVVSLCIISSDLKEALDAQAFIKSYRHDLSATPQHNANPTIPNMVFTAGIHPHCADAATESDIANINALCADNSMVAIGECGLDFNRNFSTKENQLRVFEAQLALAARCKKPVYLHERDAFDEQISLLRRYLPNIPKAVVHCFTGNKRQLEAYLDLGCYIGITGWLCDDKRANALQEAVKVLPLNKLLLETDAPYLFPKNRRPRAKNNEPCFLPFIAQKLSELTQYEVAEIAQHSYSNAMAFFDLDTVK